MSLARSTYYYGAGKVDQKFQKDMELKEVIEKIHLQFPAYGYRRVYHELLRRGVRVNAKRIRRVMKQYSLFTCLKKLFRPRGARMGKRLTFPNLILGMKLTGPEQLWCTDFTYIKLLREYIYVCAVIDVYTRVIVGWAVSSDLSHAFCLEALRVAIRKKNPPEGCIHHSDRGVQYCCEAYIDFLNERKFRISMSAIGTPEENAYIESFFKTLKREEVFFRKYETKSDVIENLPHFIDELYNKKRLHSGIGYKPPAEFEAEIQNLDVGRRPVLRMWGNRVQL